MPTRPRIDIAGYHHIMNRGIDQMDIFRHSEDKKIRVRHNGVKLSIFI